MCCGRRSNDSNQPDHRELLHAGSANPFCFPGCQAAVTARARWDGRSVRTSPGMAEETADLVGGLGRQDVFKLAGLLLDLGFAVEGKTVGEEALSQAMSADDVSRALTAMGCQLDNHAAVAGRDSRWL